MDERDIFDTTKQMIRRRAWSLKKRIELALKDLQEENQKELPPNVLSWTGRNLEKHLVEAYTTLINNAPPEKLRNVAWSFALGILLSFLRIPKEVPGDYIDPFVRLAKILRRVAYKVLRDAPDEFKFLVAKTLFTFWKNAETFKAYLAWCRPYPQRLSRLELTADDGAKIIDNLIRVREIKFERLTGRV